MQDTPDSLPPTLRDALARVAEADAAQYDVAFGRRVLDAKLASAGDATDQALRPVTQDSTARPRLISDLIQGSDPAAATPYGRSGQPIRPWIPSWHVATWRTSARWGAATIGGLVVAWAGAVLLRRPSVVASAARVYETNVGQHATIDLADGSRMQLAPGSRLEIPSDFGRATRTVTLNGEAYVTVRTSSGTPFIVRTGTIETRVLGTAFDVRHYADDSVVRIAVLSGRVAERNWRGTVHLAAGDISVMTDSSVTVTNAADVQSSIAWTQGQLIFTDTPVPAMLATLGRWYGYTFELSDSALASRYVTATFDVTKPDEAMIVLKGMLGVTVTIDGQRVILRPHQSSARGPIHGPTPTRRRTTEFLTSPEIGR